MYLRTVLRKRVSFYMKYRQMPDTLVHGGLEFFCLRDKCLADGLLGAHASVWSCIYPLGTTTRGKSVSRAGDTSQEHPTGCLNYGIAAPGSAAPGLVQSP